MDETTTAAIAREKKRLPFGWGRFGKSLDRLAELVEAGEVLETTAIGVYSEFRKQRFGKYGVGKTNVLLGVTDRRLLVVGTTLAGNPHTEHPVPWTDLEEFIVKSDKKRSVALSWPAGAIAVDSVAKSTFRELVDAVAAHTEVRR